MFCNLGREANCYGNAPDSPHPRNDLQLSQYPCNLKQVDLCFKKSNNATNIKQHHCFDKPLKTRQDIRSISNLTLIYIKIQATTNSYDN
jgi:hypothetical protein